MSSTESTKTVSEVELRKKVENDYLKARIVGETDEIKSKFTTMVFRLQKNFESRNIKTDDIISILCGMNSNFLDILQECCNIAKIFAAMHKFWSFYDYTLVKLLIEILGDAKSKDDLESYVDTLREYSKRRVCDCPSNTFSDGLDFQDCDNLVIVKIDDELKNLEMRKLSKLQNELTKLLKVKYMRLLSVEEGCIQLVFRILPREVVHKPQISALQKLGVMRLSFKQFGSLSLLYDNMNNTPHEVGVINKATDFIPIGESAE